MFPRMIGVCPFLLIAACAGTHRNALLADVRGVEGSPGLFVGHTQSGQVVIAATHYDAMTGLATTDVDLGLEARKDAGGAMLCSRTITTGSHMPRWICMYEKDANQERERLQVELSAPRLSIGRGLRVEGSSGGRASPGTVVPY